MSERKFNDKNVRRGKGDIRELDVLKRPDVPAADWWWTMVRRGCPFCGSPFGCGNKVSGNG